ncbi:response regulator [Balneatrix alpica]|uniref:response regulator n=1 Tax=Balneatrix alpica TaxID=75684 RepID=UPI0027387A98|nr:response regulator [Balneatrix alpica]
MASRPPSTASKPVVSADLLIWLEQLGRGNLTASLPRQLNDYEQSLLPPLQGLQQRLQQLCEGQQKLALGELVELVKADANDQLAVAHNQIVTSLREVTQQVVAVGQGDLRTEIRPRSERDELGHALSSMNESLRHTTQICRTLATGDTSIKVEVRGGHDELSRSINELVDTINDAAGQLETISKGDYRTDIRPRSSKDRLGNALFNMTFSLRETAQVCQVLATGDTAVKLNVKGDQDMLGRAINEMVDTLRDAAEQADTIAKGDFRAEAQPRSDKDRLGKALFSMTQSLRETTELCRALALGDTSKKLKVRHEKDALGIAINEVVDTLKSAAEQADQIAKGDFQADIQPRSKQDQLGIALRNMTLQLREYSNQQKRQRWHEEGQAKLAACMRGELDVGKLAQDILAVLIERAQALVGVFYLTTGGGQLELVASQAFTHRRDMSNRISMDQGLIGQALRERQIIVIEQLPSNYMPIGSALGDCTPQQLMLVPLVLQGEVLGVIEMATLSHFSQEHLSFVSAGLEPMCMALNSARNRTRMQELLHETQTQAEELQSQQEELRVSNEELEEQAKRLRTSEEELREQSERLQALNADLEEKSEKLEQQKASIADQNSALQFAQDDMAKKATQLEAASTYKSEFLANMSHELRTPLNSLLLLSRSMMDNDEQNLNDDQIESLRVIHKSGSELLSLINDILDLSKVEAGKMHLNLDQVLIAEVLDNLRSQFQPLAESKQIALHIKLEPGLPQFMRTDHQRLAQVLKNLLSNAVKFTSQGSVTLALTQQNEMLHFNVQDTGVGIPTDKQALIWEAFHQGDGSTSRKYGGTGLGLSISRQLAKLLGGGLSMQSVPEQGSTFTLSLPVILEDVIDGQERSTPPLTVPPPPSPTVPAIALNVEKTVPASQFLPDDRANLTDAATVLVVEDDLEFAKILQKTAKKQGFQTLVTNKGREAINLAVNLKPSAVLLDLGLPDVDGEEVLNALKFNMTTRHIPVHIISGRDRDRNLLGKGALDMLQKPLQPAQLQDLFSRIQHFMQNGQRQVLLVEDNEATRIAVTKLLENKDVTVVSVPSAEDALSRVEQDSFGCIILDLGLPGMSGTDFLQRLEEKMPEEAPPVIVYTGKDLSKHEFESLKSHTDHIVIKGVHAENRLLDEVMLFLHTMESRLSNSQRDMMLELHKPHDILKGRKVLLVDDDVRNTFALSKVLRKEGMEVVMADDGQLALDRLDQDAGIEIVLMDIMMPVMDGYEAMGRIRAQEKFKHLPIIALTAKAMSQDRAKCIEAGANDFLSKPVDIDQLVGLMRVWLQQRGE